MNEKKTKDSELRKELRQIFKNHEYFNLYGNLHGYRIEDVMSDVEEYITRLIEEREKTNE